MAARGAQESVKALEQSEVGGGKGHQQTLTMKRPWERVAGKSPALLHSFGELSLGEAGLSWRFLW